MLRIAPFDSPVVCQVGAEDSMTSYISLLTTYSFINLYKSNPGLVISAFVVGVLALLSDLYYPKFRGFMGEFWVKLELSKLPKDSYIVLNVLLCYNVLKFI